jgi:hypothetical protein
MTLLYYKSDRHRHLKTSEGKRRGRTPCNMFSSQNMPKSKTVKASQVVYPISTTLYTTQIFTAGDIKTSDMLNNVTGAHYVTFTYQTI